MAFWIKRVILIISIYRSWWHWWIGTKDVQCTVHYLDLNLGILSCYPSALPDFLLPKRNWACIATEIPESNITQCQTTKKFHPVYMYISSAGLESLLSGRVEIMRKATVKRTRSRRDSRVAVAAAAEAALPMGLSTPAALPRQRRPPPLKANLAATFTTLTIMRKILI